MLREYQFLSLITALAVGGFIGLSALSCRAQDDLAENANTVALLVAAGSAQSAGNLEDAGFLFFSAQARYQIDKQVYPPVGKGGNSPGVLKASLSFAVGQSIIPAVTGDPTVYANVIARLSKWTPEFGKDYDPGWEFEKSLGQEAAEDIVAATRKAMLTPLQHKAKLLGNEEYRALTEVVGEAQAVERRYWAAVEANRGLDGIAEELKEKLATATAKKKTAAKRMKEIEWELNPGSRWHAVVNWKAEDYFEDPQIIKLCQAIEQNDVAEMKRLIAAGVDVNTSGKDGMTLLLWAFPDRKVKRFQCLLEHGANPNVYFESDFSVGHRPFHPYPEGSQFFDDRGCHAGQTVTHLACRSPVIEYMQLVMAHGGEPNLVDKKTKETPFDVIISRTMPEKLKRVQLLIEKGANPNLLCSYRGGYPVVLAAQSHAYDAALALLKAGADPNLAKPRDDRTLVHWVLMHEEYVPFSDAKRNSDYHALVRWLKENNSPFERAKADLNRKGRLWGKDKRRQGDEELAKLEALGKVQAQKRLEKLRAIKASDSEIPKSASDWVKSLDDKLLQKIELSKDPDAKVFVMHHAMSVGGQSNEQEPWITVFADGKIVCRSRMSQAAKPVESKLNADERNWLLHLAVNECRLLERNSGDYKVKNRRLGKGSFRYLVTVKSGSNQLELPQAALVVKSLRRKLDLDGFKELHGYVGTIANRVHLGDEEETKKILKAVNKELEAKHPELPSFQLHHLSMADCGDGIRFVCTFNRKIDLGDRQVEEVTAFYVLEGDEAKVRVNVRKYTKG